MIKRAATPPFRGGFPGTPVSGNIREYSGPGGKFREIRETPSGRVRIPVPGGIREFPGSGQILVRAGNSGNIRESRIPVGGSAKPWVRDRPATEICDTVISRKLFPDGDPELREKTFLGQHCQITLATYHLHDGCPTLAGVSLFSVTSEKMSIPLYLEIVTTLCNSDLVDSVASLDPGIDRQHRNILTPEKTPADPLWVCWPQLVRNPDADRLPGIEGSCSTFRVNVFP